MASPPSIGDSQPKIWSIREGDKLLLSPPYLYRKLPENTIRLVKLLPRSYQPPTRLGFETPRFNYVYAELLERKLSDDQPYDCLSYTWGNKHEESCILLNDGDPITISVNLDSALRLLRRDNEPRYVWVDFLCINQSDIEERNQQVQLMFDIYSTAKQVVVFLGDQADGSEHLPELFRKINDVYNSRVASVPTNEVKRADLTLDVRLYESAGLPGPGDEIWSSFSKFMSRPWFRRVWILQETVAAQDLCFLCGFWGASGEGLFGIIHLADSLGLPYRAHQQEENTDPYLFEDTVDRAAYQQGLMSGLWPRTAETDNPKGKLSLLDVLEGGQRSSSSDPRDKVYAVLNLCSPENRCGTVPDYSVDTNGLLNLVAQKIIEHGQGRRLLLNACTISSSLNLPSWVPDWTVAILPKRNIVAAPITQLSVDETLPEPYYGSIRLAEDKSKLVAAAVHIGPIASVGRQFKSIDPVKAFCDSQDNHEQALASLIKNIVAKSNAAPYNMPATEGEDQAQVLSSQHRVMYDFFQLMGLAHVTDHLVQRSPKYSDMKVDDVVWRTLLCDHARSPGGSLPDKNRLFFYGFMTYTQVTFRNDLSESFASTLRAEQEQRAEIASISEAQQREQAIRYGMLGRFKRLETNAGMFYSKACRFCFSLRLATTEEGLVGMVPSTTELGDQVVYIKDMDAPLILRKCAESGEFKVVGTAFFHGFMRDELLISEIAAQDKWENIVIS